MPLWRVNFTCLFDLSFSHVILTCHFDLSFWPVILTCHFDLSFWPVILTCHSHMSVSHVILTCHSHMSVLHVILACHFDLSFCHSDKDNNWARFSYIWLWVWFVCIENIKNKFYLLQSLKFRDTKIDQRWARVTPHKVIDALGFLVPAGPIL
jgi:hypothetical protein